MTVVLSVNDDETTKIVPALDSLRKQHHRNLDIVVVPYGTAARVTTIAQTHAAQDWRIRVLRRASLDLANARNLGARKAQGSYLQFMSGGDTLPARAIQHLVASLTSTGSPFVVGLIAGPRSVQAKTTAPYDAAHDVDRPRTTLSRSPKAITDLTLGNRLFRRSFWFDAGLSFNSSRNSEVAVAIAAYDAADTFDLTRHLAYEPTNRRDGAAVGTMSDLMGTLDEWILEQNTAWRAVQELQVDEAVDAWLWGTLDASIQPFLDDIERAGSQEWDSLRTFADQLLHATGEDAWSSLRAQSRVKLWLLQHNRREQLEHFVTARWFEGNNWPTRVEAGRVYAELPHFRDPQSGVPDHCFEMTEAETGLRAILTGVRWPDPGIVEVDLLVRASFVGMPDEPEITANLVHGSDGRRVAARVVRRADSQANLIRGRKYQDYSRGAVTLVVDASRLVEASPTGLDGVDWEIDVSLDTQGLRRSGPVKQLDDRGTAGMLGTGHLGSRAVGDRRVTVVAASDAVLAFRVENNHRITVSDLSVQNRLLSGVLSGVSTGSRVRVFSGADSASAPVVDGTFKVAVPSTAGRAGTTWQVRVAGANGAEESIGWPEPSAQWLGLGVTDLVPSRSARGSLDLRDVTDLLLLEQVEPVEGGIEVSARWMGSTPRHVRLGLRGSRVVLTAQNIRVSDGALTAHFDTSWDEWGFGAGPVPLGRYWFDLSVGPVSAPRDGKVLLSDDLLDGLLQPSVHENYRIRVIRQGRDGGVYLTAPVPNDCRGAYARQQLVDWVTSDELPIESDSVYFQSYAGASATDSQLAIFEEVRRRHPELTCWWGVSDRSSRVPEGAHPVVISTREWFRALATSRRLVMNIDLDRWYSPRRGQQMLQTFHGYPAKSMGVVLWESKQYTPRRIAAELERTSADWDLILTPAPEMDEYYRREYRYDGPIHSAGYPRDDVLVSPQAATIRAETRARLGIEPRQKVILYAPTWRDDQATNWRSAELVRHLDLEAATAQLGPDYVFLMRGHRFHNSAGSRNQSTARLLDVTDYPEINDLILASDAAVLDYSSLRFDFALTGRPMLFLVPDLDSYVRGFLYDFEDSAPGPLLDTADQVIARLRDLAALSSEYAERIETFNKKFNYLQDGKAAERVVARFFD